MICKILHFHTSTYVKRFLLEPSGFLQFLNYQIIVKIKALISRHASTKWRVHVIQKNTENTSLYSGDQSIIKRSEFTW